MWLFQFHNGTIKSDDDVDRKYNNLYFNSIMVRLKGRFIRTGRIQSPEFQFHNGTIKRKTSGNNITVNLLFQFHNGTIKRGDDGDEKNFIIPFQFHNGTIKSISPKSS